MHCKDIDDLTILRFLASQGGFACNWRMGDTRDVVHAMPVGAPAKLRFAKMEKLIRRGLVKGCYCGCNGDYLLSETGKALVEAACGQE